MLLNFLIFFGVGIVIPVTVGFIGFSLILKYSSLLVKIKCELVSIMAYFIICGLILAICMDFITSRELSRIKSAFEKPKPVPCEKEI